MKRILSLLILTVLVVASCSKYDDTELRNKVNGYEARIAALEALSSYKDLLGKLSAGNTVTGFSQSGNEITLTFSDNTTVKFNQQGPKGDPGESIKGDPGDPGQDGVTPQFKIEGENWMVSYDEGKTRKNAGSAIDRSLIKDIKVEGDVLKITLADGTVVPVTYGEKEKYGFEVGGGRSGFCMLEDVQSFRDLKVTVPYTLTGNIAKAEDVEVVVVNIRALPEPWLSGYTTPSFSAEVEATDAKSGNFIIHMDRLRFDDELNFGWIDDPGEIWYTYPTLRIDAIAFFPDGTSAHKEFYSIGVRIVCADENVDWGYSSSLGVPYLTQEASAGSRPIWVRHYLMSPDLYDGPDLPLIPFQDLYSPNLSGGSMNVSAEYGQPERFSWFDDTYVGIEYKTILSYTANTTGTETYKEVSFYRKVSESAGVGFFRFRLIQAAH